MPRHSADESVDHGMGMLKSQPIEASRNCISDASGTYVSIYLGVRRLSLIYNVTTE